MAVKMRLRRMGRKNRPFYRIVVADSHKARDGRFIETLGHYDPLQDPADTELDEEKVLKWLGVGAEMSDTVRSLLSKRGVLKRWHESRFPAEKAPLTEKATPVEKAAPAAAGAKGGSAKAGKKTKGARTDREKK